ncbi:hypothetical protein HJG60_010394 [Phyllostomus discolor]|uniref:Uncharacterized protein n=1 Tax=Phyllostomus discolor TaxID=89673 RepID=A0A834AYM6_9CHIR|nr:hypothetical protein HJG60_010394 [Phyllostomus discolor]
MHGCAVGTQGRSRRSEVRGGVVQSAVPRSQSPRLLHRAELGAAAEPRVGLTSRRCSCSEAPPRVRTSALMGLLLQDTPAQDGPWGVLCWGRLSLEISRSVTAPLRGDTLRGLHLLTSWSPRSLHTLLPSPRPPQHNHVPAQACVGLQSLPCGDDRKVVLG